MHIEMIIMDQLAKRYYLPDTYLSDVPGLSFRQNCEARERIVKMHLEQIKMTNDHRNGLVHFQLAFESKMNREDFKLPEEEVKPLPTSKKVKKAV